MASSTQKKTTTKKSGSRSGSRTAKGKQPQKRPIRREVGGVILLVLALCVLVSYCGVQAILIDLLAKLLKGLFGYGYWLAGPAMLLAGGILLLHRGRPVTLRATCALLLPLLAGALFHTIFAGGDYALNGWGVLKNLWTAGLALKAGGAVSGLLAEAAVLADELFVLCCQQAEPDARFLAQCAMPEGENLMVLRLKGPMGAKDPLKSAQGDSAARAAEYVVQNTQRVTFESRDSMDVITVTKQLEAEPSEGTAGKHQARR